MKYFILLFSFVVVTTSLYSQTTFNRVYYEPDGYNYGNGIGNFRGVSGGVLKNIGAELSFGAFKGAVTGIYGSMIGAAIDGRDMEQAMLDGLKYGAISGATMAGLNIGIMGATYKPDRSYGDFGRHGPVYRRGTILWPKSAGIALGRNLVTRLKGDKDYDNFLRAHETGHYAQQQEMGFGGFYAKTFKDYFQTEGGMTATYGDF